MANVFWVSHREGYEHVVPTDAEAVVGYFLETHGHPKMSAWPNFEMDLIRFERGKRLKTTSVFAGFWGAELMCMADARASLEPHLGSYASWFPLSVMPSGEELFLLKAEACDCVVASGKDSDHTPWYEFDERALQGRMAFCTPKEPNRLLVSDVFVRLLHAKKIEGLEFIDCGRTVSSPSGP